jgi:hypothetical protein
MDRLPNRPAIPKLPVKPKALSKLGAGAPSKPVIPGAPLQAAKERVQSILGKSRDRRTAANPLLQQYLETLASGSDEAERLIAELKARGEAELERRKQLVRPLTDMLKPLNTPQGRMRFQRDVLRPAQQRQLSSQDVWDQVDRFFDSESKLGVRPVNRLIEEAEAKFGTLTFSLGVGVEGGAGAGVEGAVAIAGLRHHCVALVRSSTVAIGPYADLALCVQAAVAAGVPEDAVGLTIDVSFSAAYGVAGEVTISLLPKPHRPTLKPETGRDWDLKKVFGGDVYRGIFVDYAFAGLGVSLGVGAPALGASCGITVAESWLLAGSAR